MFNLTAHTTAHISIDCIKSCPFRENLFALAYYQTNPDTQGAIAVAQLHEPEDIHKIVPIETPPLLHIVWARIIGEEKRFILAAATRQDDIFIYTYDTTDKSLIHTKTLKVGEQVFCLYLDMLTYQDHYKLIVSSNESTVTDLTLDANFCTFIFYLEIQDKKIYSKHEYAVWTCRINPFQKDSFVCGDEVNSIYLYAQGQLVARNKKAHQQGICDLTFGNDNLLHSGGFDGIVCTFDVRKFNECLYTSNWGGTIWRVLPDAQNNNILLCNSSEKKFQIVDSTLSKQLWNSETSHESLAYAADWGKNSLITASFYDKKLCYWNAPAPIAE